MALYNKYCFWYPTLKEFHEATFWFDEVIHNGLYVMQPPINIIVIPFRLP